MEVAFDTKALRTLCERLDVAEDVLGSAVAERMKARLMDLQAARTIKDVVVGNPQVLGWIAGSDLCIDLLNGYRMVIRANHPHNPLTDSGEIDWTRVRRVKLLRIENSDAED